MPWTYTYDHPCERQLDIHIHMTQSHQKLFRHQI